MGLDMYMSRVKKIDGMTPEEIIVASDYIDYLNRPAKYADSTFSSWCGGDESKVRKDKIEDVKKNIKTQYSAWDTNHEYGHEGVCEGVAYWRKANEIHNYFEDNVAGGVDNCEPVIISKEILEDLLDRAKKVKTASKLIDGEVHNGYHYNSNGEMEPIIEKGKIIEDDSVARELLPTTEGFFFGSTDYDQWYLEDIESTIEQIAKILETTDFDTEYVIYEASW